MQLTNLSMDDHSGSLVLQPLHCESWCDTWNYYSGRYPELTGRISCCHPSISSCWDQKCQWLHPHTKFQNWVSSFSFLLFFALVLTWTADKPLTPSLCPLLQRDDKTKSRHYNQGSQSPGVQIRNDTLQLVHSGSSGFMPTILASASSTLTPFNHIIPAEEKVTHSFAEVTNAPDLEGSCGLRWIQLEVNRGSSHFGQGQALPHWCGYVKRLLGLHLTVEGENRKRIINKKLKHDEWMVISCLFQLTRLGWKTGKQAAL